MTTSQRTAAVFLMIVMFFSLTFVPTQGAGADGSLVIAALDVLKREHPKPVRVVDLLNAAIVALRKATNLGPEKVPDLPAGLDDSKAVSAFRQEFADAVRGGTMQEADLAYAATRGMLDSLHDSQVGYYDPAQWAERQQQTSGRPDFVGIGVIINSEKDASGTAWIFVNEVFSGSPAQAAGLKRFDRILEAAGKSLQNMTTREASGLIRGPEGSTVSLKIQRGTETLSVSIARAPKNPCG